MKRNGMCPSCYLKMLFTPRKRTAKLDIGEKYDNNAALTPPMGWASWNTFKNTIDEDLIYDTGKAMVEKGLADAGYKFINIDDNWHSNMRDEKGDLQGDMVRFKSGIPSLVAKLNDLGLKVGIYSSNGTLTCENLPASLHNEEKDALNFARWGIEYFKYDFCHNQQYSRYAPLVYALEIVRVGEKTGVTVPCKEAKLDGLAKFMPHEKLEGGYYISGLDKAEGTAKFDSITVDEDGEYVLTLCIKKQGWYDKTLLVDVNGVKHIYEFPHQKFWNLTARFQQVVHLNKGVNVIELSNPVTCRADSAALQYYKMGQALKKAAARVAKERGEEEKPITFSICEWGLNKPYKWGAKAGNLWRTTPDITPNWKWIVMLYKHTAKLYKYAGVGGWNDPDMLEVGNGKLTYEQNKSHFSVWCMLAAPLILGNDLRTVKQDVLDIVTNKNLIAINQDPLGRQAKVVKRQGSIDILAKPLSDGKTAICIFNTSKSAKKKVTVDLEKIVNDDYVKMNHKDSYTLVDQWGGENITCNGKFSTSINGYGVKVYIV